MQEKPSASLKQERVGPQKMTVGLQQGILRRVETLVRLLLRLDEYAFKLLNIK
jgi:hypothetical protein